MKLVVKQAAIVIGKILALYLVVPFLWVDLVLMVTALPRILFVERALVFSVLLVVLVAAAISIWFRSKVPMLFAVFALAYGFVFLVGSLYSVAFVGLLMLVAAIHFVRANRFTAPLLVLLPIVAGAWAFLNLIYLPLLVGWANHATGGMTFAESVIEGIRLLKVQFFQALMVAPLLIMHFLAKKSYVNLFVWVRSLSKGMIER
jgi:hypothetical protein